MLSYTSNSTDIAFFSIFFPPLSDTTTPLNVTLVLWQYESRIRGGLLYKQNVVFVNSISGGQLNFPTDFKVGTCLHCNSQQYVASFKTKDGGMHSFSQYMFIYI